MSIRWRVALALTGLAVLLGSLAIMAYVVWPNAKLDFGHGFTVRALGSVMLTTRQLTTAGLFGLVFGCTLSLPLAAYAVGPRRGRRTLQRVRPNSAVELDTPANLVLSSSEEDLLRAIFSSYQRLSIESEFPAENSAARNFLARPIRLDGTAGAYTIVKISERGAIRQEFINYESYIKVDASPVTARIDSPTVVTKAALWRGLSSKAAVRPAPAALRYTLAGEPAEPPTSLRASLVANPDPALLDKLFAAVGPNWWLQHHPYSFRLGLEYDRLLPAHFVLEPLPPEARSARSLNARAAPARVELQLGDVVQLQHLSSIELRADGRSLSLSGAPVAGHPPLRLRWMGLVQPAGRAARVLATRDNLLHEVVVEFDRYDLPDPLEKLPAILNERVAGTRSTIHGDLNLDNVLVGPDGLFWLIDYAQTRSGHALFDLALLEASLIGQVLSPALAGDDEFLSMLESDNDPLRAAVHAMVRRCLRDPAQIREYQLALFTACLGGLKSRRLDRRAKHRLYLTAAYLSLTL